MGYFFSSSHHSLPSSQTWLNLWCSSFPNHVITRRPTSEKSQSVGGYGKNLCPCMPCVRHALYEQQRHVIPCPVFDLPLLYLVSRGKDYSISSNPAKAVMGYISWNTAQVRAGLLDRGAIAIVVQSGAMVTQPN